MRAAQGHILAATELPTFPLSRWALAMGALDLSTGLTTKDTRTPDQREMLDSFVDQLYNGWSHKQVGRRAAAYYLPRLAESGLSYPQFVGSVIALDPGHLDSNDDIEAMERVLPPEWEAERASLSTYWR